MSELRPALSKGQNREPCKRRWLLCRLCRESLVFTISSQKTHGSL